MLIGIILLALGLSLAVAWHAAFLLVLKALLALGLLFFGLLFLLIGYSERKAARDFARATGEPLSGEPLDGETPADRHD